MPTENEAGSGGSLAGGTDGRAEASAPSTASGTSAQASGTDAARPRPVGFIPSPPSPVERAQPVPSRFRARTLYGRGPRDRDAGGERADLGSRALDDLRFIRRTMESAGAFTAVSGVGQIAVGLTALGAAALAGAQESEGVWLAVWLGEALLAALIGATGIVLKARATGVSLTSGVSRKFAVCFAPPLLCGAVLTPLLHGAGLTARLPGLWLLLFGAAVVTGGALSVRIIPYMGAAFMALGVASLLAPAHLGDVFLGAGFGGLLVGFGIVIARRHGG